MHDRSPPHPTLRPTPPSPPRAAWLASWAAALCLAACGGSDGGAEPGAAAPPAPAPATPSPPPPPPPPPPAPPPPPPPPAAPGGLYIGWYEEDPAGNPEDPTVGALFFRVPAGDGSFAGLMPFSHLGCSGGLSTGAMAGTRSGNSLGGTWSGTLDGASVGGGFSAAAVDGATPARFDGSFSNANGKQAISAGGCNYFMAAQGRFRLFDGPSREPAGVALVVGSASTAPGLGWTGVPAGATSRLRVFDEACLEATPSAGRCFLGEASSTGTGLAYPADFPGAQALAVGGRYLAVLTAQTATSGSGAGIAAFASTRFSPTEAAAPPAPPPPAPPAGLGELTLSGAPSATPGATRFVPTRLPRGGPETDGPTCFGSGSAAICSSSWLTGWAEGSSAQLQVTVGSSALGAPGPAPGSRIDTLTVQYTDPATARLYRYVCGTAPAAACDPAVHGLVLDLAQRRLRFTGTVLPEFTAGGSGSVTLQGELAW